MAAVTFDTHASIKNLISAGADEKLAEAIVDVLMDGQHSDQIELATKHDFALLKRDVIIWVGGIIIATNIISSWVMFVSLKTLISGA